MIRSNHQLNYYQAQAILDGRSPPTREDDLNDVAETGNVRKDLEVVANFSRVMNAERTKFGAVVSIFLYYRVWAIRLTSCFCNPQDGDAESVTLNLKGTSVTGTWDPASRAFELTGPDTVDAYRSILASARYVNTGKLFTIDTQRPPTKELGFTAGAR